MLSPGAKGWINKYFDLVQKGEIAIQVQCPEGVPKFHYMHLAFGNSGIVFGHPLDLIFARNLDDSKWTTEEKLKLLLFECHLFVYQLATPDKEFNQEEFLTALSEFYRFHNASFLTNVMGVFKKAQAAANLEGVLSKRVDIKFKLIENRFWVNTLSNAFVYLDVILFDDFASNDRSSAMKNYDSFAQNSLTAITLSAYADGKVEDREKDLFKVFLASAGLNEEQRDLAKDRFKEGAELEDFSLYVGQHWLLKHFLLDISALTIFSNHEALYEELLFLEKLAEYLECDEDHLDEILAMVENFVLKSKDKNLILRDNASYEKVYLSYTKRWSKIILRNKEKLGKEIRESKQLVTLLRKSTTTELNEEEKQVVKEQLKDLAKTVPAFTIFMIPGGSVLLPLVLKLIPDLVPSAFRDNIIDEKEPDQKDKETDESTKQ